MSTKPKMSRLTTAKRPKTRKGMAKYLKAALETGVSDLFIDALGDAVRLKGAVRVARKAGVSRKEMADAFSRKGRSEFSAFLSIVRAAGLKLSIKSASA